MNKENFYLVEGDIYTRLELIKEYAHCLQVGEVVSIEEMSVGQKMSVNDPSGETIIIERVKHS